MDGARAALADLTTLDRTALEALVLAQQEKLRGRDSEIEHLKLVIAKLRRMMFGTKSEKVMREIEQLELKLEELETRQSERTSTPAAVPDAREKPTRRPLPDHLPREVHTHLPQQDGCSRCGGELRKLGEDVSEMLEYTPASFKVIRHVRPKLSCTKCDVIVEAPAPSRPIERGLAGPGLLAHDQAPDRVIGHAKQLGSFRHRQPLTIFLSRTISMDAMLAPRRTHAASIPGHGLPRAHTHTV